MKYFLFLDDERLPSAGATHHGFDAIFIARSVVVAKEIMMCHDKSNVEWFLSLDHDLGENQSTGKDFVNWLVSVDMNYPRYDFFNRMDIFVHSQNCVGVQNMLSYLASYRRERVKGNVISRNKFATLV